MTDNTYLTKLMLHLSRALTLATGKPAIEYREVYIKYPFWMIFPRSYAARMVAGDVVEQVHGIAMIYAVAPVGAGYRGEHQEALYADLPAVINFLNDHPRLVYAGNGTTIPDHLTNDIPYFKRGIVMPVDQANMFGITTADRVLGLDLTYSAGFSIPIDVNEV